MPGAEEVILHRQKRMWVLGIVRITEEDEGPFPKFGVRINNDKSIVETLIFKLSGDGVGSTPKTSLFYINRTSGSIMISHKVDREKTPKFELHVHALSAETLKEVDQTLKYVIKVKDINDNAPIFNVSRYEVNVPENTAEGKEIFRVTATDADEPNNANSLISYSLISQKPSKDQSHFHINNTNGAITFKGCLNYERVKSYTLNVKARDNGHLNILSSTATVQVNIIDANNNLPAFIRTGNFSGEIMENDEHVAILRVSVTDKDIPKTPAWRAKYKIIEGNEHDHYKIETDPETNDGVLSLVKHLNYEGGPKRELKISVENEEGFFTCPDMTDEQKADALDSVSVSVNVHDINDAPVVHPSEVTVRLLESLKPNTELMRFNATDPDKFFVNKIRFVKAYDPEGWVTINEETGVVTTVHKLDRESPNVNENIYKVIIHAVDNGVPPQTGSGTLNMFLMDVNDNEPHLISTYEEMCDDGDIRHITLTAKDGDMIPFGGPFYFELLDNEQNIKEKWKLDQEFGYSVKLVRMKKIPIGNYTVPLKIRDRQGVETKDTLYLWVCHCYDGSTCPHPGPTSVVFGAVAIGLLFGTLFFLLLGFCLMLVMRKKICEALVYDHFKGKLINYNNEEPCVPIQVGTQSLSQLRQPGSEIDGFWKDDVGTSSLSQIKQPGSERDGFWKDDLNFKIGVEITRDLSYQRLIAYNTREDTQGHYQPHVYQYEGEEDEMISLDCISVVESDAGFSYLDNLEEHFITLAKICQQKK
ncbi:cadherin-like protein 26 [Mustelus asterias]